MSYEQSLVKVITDFSKVKMPKRKWEYGYIEDLDVVCISKDGTIGQIIEIQNLRIGLPATSKPYKRSEDKAKQYWERFEYPKELQSGS